jgi:uncharacterized protein YecE (DUF72 family)
VEHFDTVEINNSFYRLPTDEAFQRWRQQVPREFVFSVKASRYLTHIKRLKDPAEALALFFSRARHLGGHLGPVLFQLPPRFKLDLERLELFLAALRRHTKKAGRRCAIEFRDATWLVPAVFERLRAEGIALCFADWRDTHVSGPVTADFVYVRRHYGPGEGGNYPRSSLDSDVERVQGWLKRGLDVYLYFNNDMGGHAIRNALFVRQALASLNAGSGRRRRAAHSARRPGSSQQL